MESRNHGVQFKGEFKHLLNLTGVSGSSVCTVGASSLSKTDEITQEFEAAKLPTEKTQKIQRKRSALVIQNNTSWLAKDKINGNRGVLSLKRNGSQPHPQGINVASQYCPAPGSAALLVSAPPHPEHLYSVDSCPKGNLHCHPGACISHCAPPGPRAGFSRHSPAELGTKGPGASFSCHAPPRPSTGFSCHTLQDPGTLFPRPAPPGPCS